MTMSELRGLCADPFALSKTRLALTDGLETVMTMLNGAGVIGELWVDGSYVTDKIDPNDVDVVLRYRAEHYEMGPQVQRTAIDSLGGSLRDTLGCDAYSFATWDQGHENYRTGEIMYAYWMRQWSFDRDNNVKGIAVIELVGASP